jgi:hypothetical protein
MEEQILKRINEDYDGSIDQLPYNSLFSYLEKKEPKELTFCRPLRKFLNQSNGSCVAWCCPGTVNPNGIKVPWDYKEAEWHVSNLSLLPRRVLTISRVNGRVGVMVRRKNVWYNETDLLKTVLPEELFFNYDKFVMIDGVDRFTNVNVNVSRVPDHWVSRIIHCSNTGWQLLVDSVIFGGGFARLDIDLHNGDMKKTSMKNQCNFYYRESYEKRFDPTVIIHRSRTNYVVKDEEDELFTISGILHQPMIHRNAIEHIPTKVIINKAVY